jgi:hypothetical protein
MSSRLPARSLFDRLRRVGFLRALFVCAAILASQGSMACAFDEPASGDDIAITQGEAGTESAPSTSDDDSSCCNVCFDCSGCGGCHASATPQASTGVPASAAIVHLESFLTTPTPPLGAPPALLRPPISAG